MHRCGFFLVFLRLPTYLPATALNDRRIARGLETTNNGIRTRTGGLEIVPNNSNLSRSRLTGISSATYLSPHAESIGPVAVRETYMVLRHL
jgi:hypothetical protein